MGKYITEVNTYLFSKKIKVDNAFKKSFVAKYIDSNTVLYTINNKERLIKQYLYIKNKC